MHESRANKRRRRAVGLRTHLYAQRQACNGEVPCDGLQRLRLFVVVCAADEVEVAHEEVAGVEACLVGGGEEVEEVAWGIGRRELVFWRHDLCAYSQCQVWMETRRETRLEEPLYNFLKHTRIDVQLDMCARAQSAVEGVALEVAVGETCAAGDLYVGVGFAVW